MFKALDKKKEFWNTENYLHITRYYPAILGKRWSFVQLVRALGLSLQNGSPFTLPPIERELNEYNIWASRRSRARAYDYQREFDYFSSSYR